MTVAPAGIRGRLTTEASTPCSSAFDGDDWLFSVDWEGSRCLLIANDGSVRLQGENAPLDDRFPEIVAAATFFQGRTAILDGTICVLDGQGRPDLAALFRRVAAGHAHPLAIYLVTDVLQLDGESLTARPLLARLVTLSDLIPRDSRIQAPDHVVGRGRALAAAAGARGLAALLARRQGARYQAGMASPDRLRIPLSKRRDAVVVGWRSTASGVRLMLGDWTPGTLSLVGTAVVEEAAARRWLTATAEPATTNCTSSFMRALMPAEVRASVAVPVLVEIAPRPADDAHRREES